MITWTIEKIKIKDLKPHPTNPRRISKHDAQNLQRSLEKFGLIDKPIVTTDRLIIGGHQRISILKKLGHKEVECFVPDTELTPKEINELNIGMNRIHGDFDYEILANHFAVEDLCHWGFTAEDLDLGEDESAGVLDSDKGKNKKTCPNCGHEL